MKLTPRFLDMRPLGCLHQLPSDAKPHSRRMEILTTQLLKSNKSHNTDICLQLSPGIVKHKAFGVQTATMWHVCWAEIVHFCVVLWFDPRCADVASTVLLAVSSVQWPIPVHELLLLWFFRRGVYRLQTETASDTAWQLFHNLETLNVKTQLLLSNG